MKEKISRKKQKKTNFNELIKKKADKEMIRLVSNKLANSSDERIEIFNTSKEERIWIQEIFSDCNLNVDVYSIVKKGERIMYLRKSKLD